MTQVLVIGAHGKIALLAERLLVEEGHAVTGVVRNPDHADDVRATGAAVTVADVEHLDTAALTELVSGFDTVVWSAGAGGGSPERTYAVDRDAAIRTVDAAAAASVQHVVMVSYFGAGPDHGVPSDNSFFAYAEAKTAADAHLEAAPVGWTILRPSTLTDGPEGGIGADDTEGREVSRATVARVVATVVAERAAATGRVITFNDGDQDVARVVTGG
ncbi:SDR family oxidoreductase [Nocardioides dongxiaopingii]|uniref:SDR family oxidoreductase n=1 Tax=Nocardioides dongxiaopingii TaxID=2576036 RepID=UPI0010C76AAD|nr:SDR family oxidoreductase [Nocardioides dongxiaopingii]